ncbi:hypothetical protein ACFLT9_02720 [Acidobacteriota bacterium]
MNEKNSPIFLLKLFVFSAAAGICFLLFPQVKKMSFSDHSFSIDLLMALLVSAIVFLILYFVISVRTRILSARFALPAGEVKSHEVLIFMPLLFFFLVPLANIHYISAEDLRSRLTLLLLAVLFSMGYMKAIELRHLFRNNPAVLKTWSERFACISSKKKILLLFLIALVLYNCGSLLIISRGIEFSGDEPHYLIISHSLLNDGDIDLSNNYNNREYREYMPPQTELDPHIAPGTKRRYSFHSPGFSGLMLPFYAFASLFKGKAFAFIIRFFMSLIGALLGIQIFLYAKQAWKKETTALKIWALFCFTSPIYFYSIHFYPELLITLLSLYIFRMLTFKAALDRKLLLGIGFVLSTFIWFHAIKYVIIAGCLILYGLWVLIRKHGIKRELLYFLLFPVILTILHLAFQHSVYGSFSPSAISTQGQAGSLGFIEYVKAVFTDIPFRYRWETLAGFFLDQKDGFLLYAPFYFFAFLGVVEMFRHKRRDLFALLFVISPYILFTAFMTQRTGYAPQARPVISVAWGFIVLVGYFLVHNKKKIFSVLFSISVFISSIFVYLMANNPFSLYQLTTFGETERGGTLFYLLSNLHFSLPKFLPSFLKLEDGRWLPNIIWLAGIGFFIFFYMIIKKHDFQVGTRHQLVFVSLSLAVFFVGFVLFPRPVLLYPQNTSFSSGEKVVFYSLGSVARMKDPGRLILPASDRSYTFYFTSWREINKFRLEWGAEKGKYDVRLLYFDTEIFSGVTENETITQEFSPQKSYPLQNRNLYRISIFLKGGSDYFTAEYPYHLSIIPIN